MDWASLVLRLGLGIIFIGHGCQKAFGALGGSGIKGFAGMLSSLGFAPALFWAYLAGYTELVCGVFLVLGILTRLSSTLLLVLMAVAVYKVHLAKGFFLSAGGFEYGFLIICACIALILMGGGRLGLTPKL
ncbi:MAG: DoxX family protein [Candidatus Omnitrophota bacterium]